VSVLSKPDKITSARYSLNGCYFEHVGHVTNVFRSFQPKKKNYNYIYLSDTIVNV